MKVATYNMFLSLLMATITFMGATADAQPRNQLSSQQAVAVIAEAEVLAHEIDRQAIQSRQAQVDCGQGVGLFGNRCTLDNLGYEACRCHRNNNAGACIAYSFLRSVCRTAQVVQNLAEQ